MGAYKAEARSLARDLREQGWTMRRIAHQVGVALSTVSGWVRDIDPAIAVNAVPAQSDATPAVQIEVGHRRCGSCLRDLPLTSFNRHPTGYQWRCRNCYREYFRARAALPRIQVAGARRRRRQEARAFIDRYLGTHHCSDCGEGDPRALEFHHTKAKRANVTDLVRAGYSTHALERELSSCTVLCTNCHRVRTAAEQGSWRHNPASLDVNPRLTSGERRNLTYVRDLLLRSCCTTRRLTTCGARV